MTIEKLKPDENVTKVLASIIQQTQSSWKNISPNRFSLDEFLDNKTPPLEDNIHDGSLNFYNLRVETFKEKLNYVEKYLNADENTNCIVYPPKTVMKWHTNSDNPGTRTYYTFSVNPGIFRYKDKDGNIVDDYDNVGWTVRRFEISETEPMWHTIWSEGVRFAFGFNEKKPVPQVGANKKRQPRKNKKRTVS